MNGRRPPSVCNVCGLMVSTKRSPRLRLARPDGGFDHAHCSLGMPATDFAELDKSAHRHGWRGSQGTKWVRVIDIPGGWQFHCRLCGRDFKRTFSAADTNHSEALRLATAYASRHALSRMHALALEAFLADAPDPSPEEALLTQIFGRPASTEQERRRLAARWAARRFQRSGGAPVDA